MIDTSDLLSIGMIHLPKIQTTSLESLIEYTCNEAKKLEQIGFSAIMIENFNDTPFQKTEVSEELLIKISIICHELRKLTNLKLGLNLLRNACSQAMKIATFSKFDFIRCNVWEGAYVTDQGIIEGSAAEVMECKNQLNSQVQVFADIFVKHAKPLVLFDPKDVAENAIKRGRADRIIISGNKTGDEPSIVLLDELNQIGVKPIIGSGMNNDNIDKFVGKISGAIVGTSIKIDNKVQNPISIDHGKKFITKWNNVMD